LASAALSGKLAGCSRVCACGGEAARKRVRRGRTGIKHFTATPCPAFVRQRPDYGVARSEAAADAQLAFPTFALKFFYA